MSGCLSDRCTGRRAFTPEARSRSWSRRHCRKNNSDNELWGQFTKSVKSVLACTVKRPSDSPSADHLDDCSQTSRQSLSSTPPSVRKYWWWPWRRCPRTVCKKGHWSRNAVLPLLLLLQLQLILYRAKCNFWAPSFVMWTKSQQKGKTINTTIYDDDGVNPVMLYVRVTIYTYIRVCVCVE